MTDAGLEHLKGLSNLRSLDLSNTGVTDAGLEHLKGLKSLRSLDLRHTKVSDEGVSRLQEALPDCKIEMAWWDRLVVKECYAIEGMAVLDSTGRRAANRVILAVRTQPSAAKRTNLKDFRLVLSDGSEIPAAQGMTFGDGGDTWIVFAPPRQDVSSGALKLKDPDSRLGATPGKNSNEEVRRNGKAMRLSLANTRVRMITYRVLFVLLVVAISSSAGCGNRGPAISQDMLAGRWKGGSDGDIKKREVVFGNDGKGSMSVFVENDTFKGGSEV